MPPEKQGCPLPRLGDVLKAAEEYLCPMLTLLHCSEPRSPCGSFPGSRA